LRLIELDAATSASIMVTRHGRPRSEPNLNKVCVHKLISRVCPNACSEYNCVESQERHKETRVGPFSVLVAPAAAGVT
jgi:hypothetical protein